MPFKPIKKLVCSNIMHKNTLVNYQADSALSNEWGLMSLQKCDSWIKTDTKLNSRHTQSFIIFKKKTVLSCEWFLHRTKVRGREVGGEKRCWGSITLVCLSGWLGCHGPLLSALPLAFKPAQHNPLKGQQQMPPDCLWLDLPSLFPAILLPTLFPPDSKVLVIIVIVMDWIVPPKRCGHTNPSTCAYSLTWK